MSLFDENTKNQVKEKLKEMDSEVKLLLFTGTPCEMCEQVSGMLDELSELSNKIVVEKYTPNDKEMMERYKIDKFPIIVVTNGNEKGLVRFCGLPSGYEFSTLLTDLIDISKGTSSLNPELTEKAKSIDKPVHIQVFVTPSCPYCPGAVKIAHDLAIVNPNIVGDMVEVLEFRELGQKYQVQGVPRTVANDTVVMEGLYPPDIVIKKILEEA